MDPYEVLAVTFSKVYPRVLADYAAQAQDTLFANRRLLNADSSEVWMQAFSGEPMADAIAGTDVFAEFRIAHHDPLPAQRHWVSLHRNLPGADDPILRYLPYFGERAADDVDLSAYEGSSLQHPEMSEKEEVGFRVLTAIIEETGANPERIAMFSYYLIRKYGADFVDFEMESFLKLLPVKIHGVSREAQFTLAGSSMLLDWPVPFLVQRWLSEYERQKKSDGPFQDSFSSLFCRMCMVYDCQSHSVYGEVPFRLSDHRDEHREKPCSERCFRNNKKPIPCEWSDGERYLLKKCIHSLRLDYCDFAAIIRTKTCVQVHSFVIDNNLETAQRSHQYANPFKPKKWSRPNLRKLPEQIGTALAEKQPKYTPCHHPGKNCDGEWCECFGNKVFCEKFCLCDAQCYLRFPGCSCKSRCETNQCPCYTLARECDPDTCVQCGQSGDCCNNGLQSMKQQHLLMAKSDIAGWGIFSRCFLRKNQFISEYKGEASTGFLTIGAFYDHVGTSFLFNLNQDEVIDSTLKGNKIRFANHSSDPNCYAKVVRVNGQHRIGIYAARDVSPGEELFFDYHYKGEAAKYVK